MSKFNAYRAEIAGHAAKALLGAEYGSPEHDSAGLALWAAIGSTGREQLVQLLKGPVWDGDVVSKNARGHLFELGLAVRVCFKGQQGYTAASYLAFTVHEIGKASE